MIRHFDVQQSGRPVRGFFTTRHRVGFAAVIAGVAALALFVAQTAPQESLSAAVPVISAATAMPTATEPFEYFPQLYENQAKQVEEPLATF